MEKGPLTSPRDSNCRRQLLLLVREEQRDCPAWSYSNLEAWRGGRQTSEDKHQTVVTDISEAVR